METLRLSLREGQDFVNDLKGRFNGVLGYLSLIRSYLGCDYDDQIAILRPRSDSEDEEGWTFESFFEDTSKIKVIGEIEKMELPDYIAAGITLIEYNGVRYWVEQDASPMIIYGKYQMLEE